MGSCCYLALVHVPGALVVVRVWCEAGDGGQHVGLTQLHVAGHLNKHNTQQYNASSVHQIHPPHHQSGLIIHSYELISTFVIIIIE